MFLMSVMCELAIPLRVVGILLIHLISRILPPDLKSRRRSPKGDAVRLDIDQETEDITLEEDSAGYPQSRKRILNTNVLVNDGDILVLGGLITDNRSETQRRVPLLSKIPILGHLFKDRDSRNTSQTLMIFIRPTILRTPDDSRDFSRERYAELRLEQLLYGQQIDSFLPDDVIEGKAVLPEIKDDDDEDQPAVTKRRVRVKRGSADSRKETRRRVRKPTPS